MSSTSDQLIDRRRLQRRLSLWRVLTFAALLIAVVVAGFRLTGSNDGPVGILPHVARVSITGLIVGDKDTIKLIDDVAKSNASAALIEIDSPGGTTTGSERLYDALRRLSAKMPTVAVVRGLAASGAYIAAVGTDHIIAQQTSLVGSIGVLFQFPNVADALGKLGVKVETIKSSPLKASPSGFEPTTPEAKAAIDALVVDSYAWFKALVKDRRKMDDQQLAAIDDGRVFTGRQGVPLHLVDGLGEERDAIKYLEQERKVPANLPVRDWKTDSGFAGFKLFSFAAGAANAAGLPSLASVLAQGQSLAEGGSLSGLVAIWPVR